MARTLIIEQASDEALKALKTLAAEYDFRLLETNAIHPVAIEPGTGDKQAIEDARDVITGLQLDARTLRNQLWKRP